MIGYSCNDSITVEKFEVISKIKQICKKCSEICCSYNPKNTGTCSSMILCPLHDLMSSPRPCHHDDMSSGKGYSGPNTGYSVGCQVPQFSEGSSFDDTIVNDSSSDDPRHWAGALSGCSEASGDKKEITSGCFISSTYTKSHS